MKIEINIGKKHLYVLISLAVILLGVIGVVAYGTTPQLNGHSIEEIEPTGLTNFVKNVKVDNAVNADTVEGQTVAQIQAGVQVGDVSTAGCTKVVTSSSEIVFNIPDQCKSGTCHLILTAGQYNMFTQVTEQIVVGMSFLFTQDNSRWSSLSFSAPYIAADSVTTFFYQGINGQSREKIIDIGSGRGLFDDPNTANGGKWYIYGNSELWVC